LGGWAGREWPLRMRLGAVALGWATELLLAWVGSGPGPGAGLGLGLGLGLEG
jgi:hypothetical protein